QTGIEIGANIDLVVRSLLEEPIKQHCVSVTADLWIDDLWKRTYLDFTIFFANNISELNHTLLRYTHFEEEESGINIWYETEEIFKSFNLSFGDTPVNTYQGSNMAKALSLTGEVRYSSLYQSDNALLVLLRQRDEQHRLVQEQRKLIKEGIHIFVNAYNNGILSSATLSSSSNETNSSPIEKKKKGPFAIMRNGGTPGTSIKVSANSFKNEVPRQTQIYDNTSYN
ncbi:unnamed protein product, partial [Rotaria sp. Silwood1]